MFYEELKEILDREERQNLMKLAARSLIKINYIEKDIKNFELENPALGKQIQSIIIGNSNIRGIEITPHKRIYHLQNGSAAVRFIQGNDRCFCKSGKKYKKCCGK